MCSRSRDFRENHWRVKIYCIVMGVLQKRKNEGVILFVVLNRDLRCFAIVHFRRGENLAINGRCVFILYTAKRETSAVVFCCMIWLDSLWVYVTSKFFTQSALLTLNEPIINGSRHLFYWMQEPETCDKRNFSRSRKTTSVCFQLFAGRCLFKSYMVFVFRLAS